MTASGGLSGESASPDVTTEKFSVLVCTRNRPQDLARLLDSLVDGGAFEIVVIDQSDDSRSEALIRQSPAATRIRYVRSQARGKGAALNEGLRLARSELIVCTDDDCEAAPGWATQMAAGLVARPRAAMVFCRVEAPPYDETLGYVPEYLPERDARIKGPLASAAHRGLGAGMALRRDAIIGIGGVDESFGPGSRFGSADDWDLEVRALIKGWEVYDIASLRITHHGFRTFAEGRGHARRDWRALGAAAAKPVRAGHPLLLMMGVYVLMADGLRPIATDLLHGRAPRGAGRVTAFCRGFASGLLTPVDRRTLTYRTAPEAGSPDRASV